MHHVGPLDLGCDQGFSVEMEESPPWSLRKKDGVSVPPSERRGLMWYLLVEALDLPEFKSQLWHLLVL